MEKLKYLLIIHAESNKYSMGGDVTIPLRGETLDEARAYALKMLRGDRSWWSGRLIQEWNKKGFTFRCYMDGEDRAHKDLEALSKKVEFYGHRPAVPALDYLNHSCIRGVRIVEFVEDITLLPLLQEFTDWKYDEEKRLREERERAEYERLKAKFE